MRLLFTIWFILVAIFSNAQAWNWATSASSTGNELANKVAIDAAGNIYVAGSWDGSDIPAYGAHFSGGTKRHYGGFDGFIAKYNSSGVFQWAFNIGDDLDDEINDITIGADGFLYITGYFTAGTNDINFKGVSGATSYQSSAGGKDIFLAKYDPVTGNLEWDEVGGGTGDDEGKSVKMNGDVYLTGYYTESASFDNVSTNSNTNGADFFLARFDDTNGVDLWVRDAGNTGNTDDQSDIGYDLVVDATDVYVSGTFHSKSFDYRTSGNTVVQNVANYTTGGGPSGIADIFIAKYQKNGTLIWNQKIGNTLQENASGLTSDNDYLYLIGTSQQPCIFPSGRVFPGQTSVDVFVTQLNKSNGVENWINYDIPPVAGAGQANYDITHNGDNKLYIVGDYAEDITFGGVDLESPVASSDGFLLSYCTDSLYRLVNTLAGSGFNSLRGVVSDGAGNVYAVGEFNANATADALPVTNSGGQDIFVGKLIDASPTCALATGASPSGSPSCGAGNTENFPAGTWVIGMDNTTQPGINHASTPPGYLAGGGGPAPFNLRAYGLATELLHNEIPLYWAIDSGKTKDGIDFSSTGYQLFPTNLGGSNAYDFRSGPLVIHPDDTAAARPIIQAFGNSVRVYQLDASTSIQYEYKLMFKPKILILNNGGQKNSGGPWQYDKHTRILIAAGIDMANVDTTDAVSISLDDNSCYTIASEAHWRMDEGGDIPATNAANAPLHTTRLNQFVHSGGNFLTQCAGIEPYENNENFQTTNGIIDHASDGGGESADAHVEFNFDHPFYQINGNITQDPTGTFVDYELNGGNYKAEVDTFIHKEDPTPSHVVSSGIKLTGADTLGGNVFYLGGHDYLTKQGTDMPFDIEFVNGVRLYLNAILIPAYRPACPSLSFCAPSCNLNITCPTIDTALANASCQYVLGDYRDSATVNASCGLDSIQQIPAAGTVVNAGVQEIFLVATDSSGNTDTCSFNLVITIPINPQVVVCGDAFTNETTQNFNDNLNNFTGCTNHPTTGEDKYYQITVPSGNYQIQVTMGNMVDDEEATADIFWLGGSCPSTTNCLAQTEFRQSDQEFTSTNSNQIVYYATGPGTYYLVVDATIDYIDQYDIAFNCVQSGIIFDTINSACDANDLNNDGIVAYVDNDTSLIVNKCDTFSFRHDMYIANVNGVEWMDTVNFSLDSCYENVHNIIPNGVNNAMENPAGGDWTAVYTAGNNNIAWSFSDAAYANLNYGDGSQFSGSYSCNQGSTHDYMFSFDATIKENCPISSTLPISILVRDDGVSTATTSPGLATVISDDYVLTPLISNNVIAQDSSICLGSPLDTIIGLIPTGGNGSYTYLWQVSFDSLNWTNAPGVNNTVLYEPPATFTNTLYIRRIVTSICPDISKAMKITVFPAWPAWNCKDVCVNDLPIDLYNCVTPLTNGTADNVVSNNNVTSANDILGINDGNFAEFYEDLDDIYIDLTDTIPIGRKYFITWRQRPGEVATSTFNIYESVDNVVYTLHSTGPIPTTIETFFTEAIVAENPTRFLRIERVGAAMRDFDIDGISYAFSGSTPGTWSGPAITGSIFDPTVAGIGAHVITYTAGIAGCTTDSTRTINVVNGPCWNFINDSTSTDNDEIGNDVAVDSINQFVYVVGLFEDTASFRSILDANMNAGGGSGNTEGFLAKYDFYGNMLWVVNMGGVDNDEATGVTVGPAGNIYVTGYIDGNANLFSTDLSITPLVSSGNEDVFIAKYSPAGLVLWANAEGGVNNDRGHDISASATAVYVTGLYEDIATIGGINTEATYNNQINTFLSCYDLNTGVGNWLVEAKSDGDDNFGGETIQNGAMSVVTYDTNIYVMGHMASDSLKFVDSSRSLVNAFQLNDPNNGADNLFIYSVSEDGNFNWTQQIDNISSAIQLGTGISADCDGVYISGSSHDGALFPGPDSLIPFNHDKAFLAKLSPFDGTELWLQQWDGNASHSDVIHDVVADGFGNVYALGTYNSSSLAHPSETLGAADGQELMIFKFLNDGTYVWGQKSIGGNDDYGYAIAASGKDFVFATGEYSDAFQLGQITASPTTDDRNLFLARLGTDGTTFTSSCCAVLPVGGVAAAPSNEICPGDSVNITLSAYTGNIQWEVSYNSGGSWSNIGSGTDNEMFLPSADSAQIRATLSIADCPDSLSNVFTLFYDTTAPVITCLADTTVYTDAGSCVATNVILILPTVVENCAIDTIGYAGGTTFSIDTTLITWTVLDSSGNFSTCTQNVIVVDSISPVINCPANQNDTLNAGCQFVLPYYGAGTATDNCSLDTVFQSPVAGTVITGTTTITLTAQDSTGNTSVCTFDVILTDVTPPIFTSCANNQTLYADASCGDTLINYMDSVVVTDNCGTPTLTQNPIVGSTVTGNSIVWIIAEDANGNKDSCSFNVSVMDTTRPVINCISNQTRYVDATCDYSLENFGVTATDNCQMLSTIQSPAAGTAFGRDTVLVTITATDTAGNVSICTFDVFILDTISPVINCPANQNETPDASCQFTIPYYGTATATDNCSLDTVFQSPVTGTVITGTTTITLTAQDSAGNTSVCTFDVILIDVTPPIFTSCANDQTLYADASCGDTLINYMDSVVVTDNCGTPTLTQNPVVGTTVTGSSIVWIIAEDANGNKDSCSFNVTVVDTTRPVINCIANQTRYVDATCDYSLENFGVTATDNCQMLSTIQSPAAGTAFGRDTVLVTITATDTAGNVSVCTFDVFILDTISPVINCPANQNETPDASCQFTIPYYGTATATDNCSLDTVFQSPVAGTVITGTTTITLTAQDSAGNTSVCTFDVILTDVTPPIFTSCANNQILYADASCGDTLINYMDSVGVTDNCGTPTLTQNPTVGSTVTNNSIVWVIAEDANGNKDSCSFNVTVVDTTRPSFTCLGDQDRSVPVNCTYTLEDFTSLVGAADNCSIQTINQTPAIGTSLSLGTTSIVVTATDTSGNSNSCTFNVIIDDTVSIICPSDTASCDSIISFSNPDVSDNCSSITLTQTDGTGLMSGNAFPVGITTLSYEATDTVGNSSACSFNIEIFPSADAGWAGLPINLCEDGAPIDLSSLVTTGTGGTWSGNGVNGNIFNPSITGTGTQSITYSAINGTCSSDSTLSINVVSTISANAGMNDTVCTDSVTLSASGTLSGFWTSTSSNASFEDSLDPSTIAYVNQFDTYTFIWSVNDTNCPDQDSVEILFYAPLEIPDAGPDQYLLGATSTTLEATSPSIGMGIWNVMAGDGMISEQNNPLSSVNELSTGENIITWTVTNGPCVPQSDSMIIIVENIRIPTGFSPDGDGINDMLEIEGVGTIKENKIIIVNRWGTEVYEMNDYQNDWTGINKSGDKLPSDTYFMILISGDEVIAKTYLEIKY